MPGFSLATAYYHIALSNICILATAAVGKKKKNHSHGVLLML